MHVGNKDKTQSHPKSGSIPFTKPHYMLKKFIEKYQIVRDLIHHPKKISEYGENPEELYNEV
jgi:hypothetical protein